MQIVESLDEASRGAAEERNRLEEIQKAVAELRQQLQVSQEKLESAEKKANELEAQRQG